MTEEATIDAVPVEIKLAEEKFAEDMGRIMTGISTEYERESTLSDGAVVEKSHFEFDQSFQERLVNLVLTDNDFNRSTEGLIDPAYFENQAHAAMIAIGLGFFNKYKTTPSLPTLQRLVKYNIEKKVIRKDIAKDVVGILKSVRSAKDDPAARADKEFYIDEVATFARHQAMSSAAYELINLLEKREFDKASDIIRKANEVGRHSDAHSYNYFDEIDSRTERRKEILSGVLPPQGISSGFSDFDKYLFHKGWGRRELTVFMGPPKSGKSTALADFAKNAALQGKNALYLSLEVSTEIISTRLDANVAEIMMNEVMSKPIEVRNRIEKMGDKSGVLMIEERPSGSMTPSEFNRIVQKYKKDGIIFDLVALDYADLMSPERYTQDAQENSKSIYVDIRAIAQREGFALLTATQTNREGSKSTTARMEHVADDYNKVRIADLLISINKTEDERKLNIVRLFFAASRNQQGGFTIKVNQDQARMKFITSVIGEEDGGLE